MAFLKFISRIVHPQSTSQRFFGLMLRESSATGYAFEQTADDIEIVKSKSFPYTKGFENILDDVDTVLYEFESDLKCHFDKIIFFLPSSGLKEGSAEVVSPYRTAISEISHSLELQPMGYIEIVDVLKNDLAAKNSEVYIESGKMKTQLIFLHAKDSWKRLTVATNPANIVSHIDEFVTRGTVVSLYSIHEGANTNILSAALSGYLPLVYSTHDINVHIQKILKAQLFADTTSEDSTQSPHAVTPHSNARNDESGGLNEDMLVVDSHSVRVQDDTLHTNTHDVLQSVHATHEGGGSHAHIPVSTDEDAGGHAHGHVDRADDVSEDGDRTTDTLSGEDVSSERHTDPTQDTIEGFAIYRSHRDSHETPDGRPPQDSHERVEVHNIPSDDVTTYSQEDPHSEGEEESHDQESPADEESDRTNSRRPLGRIILLTAGALACIVLSSSTAFELFLHRVTVVLTVPTEVYTVTQKLDALAITKVIEEKDVDVRVDTTGEQLIGERAKGNVILASFDDKQASFSAGTIISHENMAYTIDTDVVLPASSIDTTSGTKRASQKSVAASATFIGTAGNIEKGSQFTVSDYPSSLYYARAEGDFQGGSQETVSVISADDMDRLERKVQQESQNASDSARDENAGDMLTLEDISTVDASELDYSGDVGEIASYVQAKGSVKAVLYTVSKRDLVQGISRAIHEQKGKEYDFLNSDVTYTFANVLLSQDEQTVTADLESSVRIFKAVNVPGVKQAMRLKSREMALTYLREKGAMQVDFEFDPRVPLFDRFMPLAPEKIEVQIVPRDESSVQN